MGSRKRNASCASEEVDEELSSWVRVVRDNFLFFTRVLVTLTLQEALLAAITLIVELFREKCALVFLAGLLVFSNR